MGVRVENLGKNLGNLNKVKIGLGKSKIGGEIFFSPTLKNSTWSLSNNNQTASSSMNLGTVLSENAATSGKWYWEISFDSGTQGSTTNVYFLTVGIATSSSIVLNDWLGQHNASYAYAAFNGTKYQNNISETFGSTFTPGSIIGVALDADNGRIWWSLNGTYQANGDPANGLNPAYSGISGTFRAGLGAASSNTEETVTIISTPATINYSPPTGFLPGLG